jgi:hypothetical protein
MPYFPEAYDYVPLFSLCDKLATNTPSRVPVAVMKFQALCAHACYVTVLKITTWDCYPMLMNDEWNGFNASGLLNMAL